MSNIVNIFSSDVVLSISCLCDLTHDQLMETANGCPQQTPLSQTLTHVGETSCQFLCSISMGNLFGSLTWVSGALLITVIKVSRAESEIKNLKCLQ